MSFLKASEIQYIQIDHTSRCNLSCPQCARIHNGRTHDRLPLKELELSDYKNLFSTINLKNIKQVVQCGNYGDIVASKNILECLSWLREQGYTADITIMTNGSAQPKRFWTSLAKIIGHRGKVAFSIDGLKDTNPQYRIGSQWDKIIENAQTYIRSGGRARWDFLVFRHNEHQVQEILAYAKKLGFEGVFVKKTNRFINNENYKGRTLNTQLNFSNKQHTQSLEVPAQKKYIPQSTQNFNKLLSSHGSWDNYVNQTKIQCLWKKERKIFIDFRSKVWPCTWVGSGVYHFGENFQKSQIQGILRHYGEEFNSLKFHSLDEILDHEWFRIELERSWARTMQDMPIPKLMTCGRTCGEEYDFTSSSKNNREYIAL